MFSQQQPLRPQTIQQSLKTRLSRWHWLVLLVSVLLIAGVLGLTTSNDAKATRSERAFWSGALPDATSAANKMILPLHLPPPTGHLLSTNFQDAALSEQDWQTVIVGRGDNLSSMFVRLGLGAQEVQDILDLGPPAATLTHLRPGQQIKVKIDDRQELQDLIYEVDEKSLHIHRAEDKLQATDVKHTIETRISYASGVINSSLFEAAQESGLTDNMTLEMAAIFRWDIDFAQNLRAGDSFTVLYEEYYLAGEKMRDGPILAAEFTNRGKTYRALRFQQGNDEALYYTPQGLSLRKAFLISPVKFTRISSGFNLNRYHPVLHRIRAHKGVDYAAPYGTPITAASNGKVEFRGTKGGYGNTVVLQHAGNYSTLYAHMSGFAKGIKQGGSVKQGQIIGYLGQSGLATGPHLHYEFRVNGVHKDPLKAKLPKAEPILAQYKSDFIQRSTKLTAQMDLLKSNKLALKAR
ncbi:MAG: peptidoglycan DD-metalloendopeptidase family protein [Gammaproteobacteria bacterium]